MENRLIERSNGKALKNMENWLIHPNQKLGRMADALCEIKVPKTKQS